MSLEKSLYFITHHSESIIQWVFFAILLLSAYVIGRALFGPKEQAGASPQPANADNGDIKGVLQKILDQTNKLENVSLDKLGAKAAGDVEAQVQALKKDLATREEELKALKTTDPKVAGDADKLSVRIKELETKLAEYEILEDDIADLSLYKEENLRLRSELDKLKGITPDAPAPAPTAEPAPQPVPGEDIVAEFAQAVNQTVVPGEPAEGELKETGDPLADFETAMKLEKKIAGDPLPPVAPVVAPPPTAPHLSLVPNPQSTQPADAVPAGAQGEGDDLFAEFANPPAEAVEGHSLDTDKMMAEMAELVSMEPTKGSALHDEIDTDKMAAEATRLTKT